MKYLEARPKIRSGDLLAWSHRAWGSWYDLKVQAVRFFTQSEYCHVGIAWRVAGRLFALEAVQPRVRIFPLAKLTPFYWLPMGIHWSPIIEEFALQPVGEPYSENQAVLAFLGKLAIGEDHQWQCAEYAVEVLKACGLDVKCTATPTEVVRAVQKLGSRLELVEGPEA